MERLSHKLVFLAVVAALACVTLPVVEAACKRDVDCRFQCPVNTPYPVCSKGKCDCIGGAPTVGGVCKVDGDCAKLCPPGSKSKNCIGGKCFCGD